MSLFELDSADYGRVRPLVEALDFHLPVIALIEGTSPGKMVVDDAETPRAVLARTGHRYFLAGAPDLPAFNQALGRLFAETIYPQGIAAGDELFSLAYDPPGWEAEIGAILGDRHPLRATREYYELAASRCGPSAPLPEGFALRPADRALLEDERVKNLEELREEMCSERSSVDEFLAKSFGLCPIYGDELAGWCLSEYNTADRCEIGIASLPPFRRRGLATALTGAFVKEARARGTGRIGWHCSAGNLPSGATALKAGFEQVRDYAVYLTGFDPVYDRAMNGKACLDAGQYEQAMAWYEQALAYPDAPGWVSWRAACAAAGLGQKEAALRQLAQAIDKGFRDVERLQASEHLAGLHGTQEWDELLRRAAGPRGGQEDE